MFVAKIFSRASRSVSRSSLLFSSSQAEKLQLAPILSNQFHSIVQESSQKVPLFHHPTLNSSFQIFQFSSSASPEAKEKERGDSDSKNAGDDRVSDQTEDVPSTKESGSVSDSQSKRRRQTSKRVAFSDSSSESDDDLSMDDLVKVVAEKEELLKEKHKEIEKMQDKVLRTYAEMENVMDRTRREAQNTKKFAIQNFAKGLLDVADNLGRASSVVKDSFSKIDASKDSSGAVPLLKTLLEGVEMTEKQLGEVLKKSGVEKFDPTDKPFDPHRHNAIFEIPDGSKPSGTVAVVLKSGYMLYNRVLRPAEVGMTKSTENDSDVMKKPLKLEENSRDA